MIILTILIIGLAVVLIRLMPERTRDASNNDDLGLFLSSGHFDDGDGDDGE